MAPTDRPGNDASDSHIPSGLWWLLGNRTPAPTCTQYEAMRGGNFTTYQAAHAGKRVIPRKVTKTAFSDFELNPLSSRGFRKVYAKAVARAKGLVSTRQDLLTAKAEGQKATAKDGNVGEQHRPEPRIAKLEARIARLRAKNKALRAAIAGPAAVVAMDDDSLSSGADEAPH